MSLEALLLTDPIDQKLYDQALTHPSAIRGRQKTDFERFEFLGDRVLGLVIAEQLLTLFPHEKEGELAKRQATLVRKETLRQIAETVQLNRYLKANTHDMGSLHSSILSDAMEALIGALYLDQGLEPCRRFILHHWDELLDTDHQAIKDPKSVLQEWVQRKTGVVPIYTVVAQSGPDHAPTFTVAADVPTVGKFEATASTRRLAEKAAAEIALRAIKDPT